VNKSREVKDQIVKEYTYDGSYYSPKNDDITKYLILNKIDNDVSAMHSISGFDISDDKSLAVFTYDDSSALIVSSGGIQSS
jgi:hypothetical protein